MKKTGELLKKAREQKGLSLHEIGLSLKINSKVLKAIEDGDDLNLPAKTFLRGFVQSYANFLHLNSEDVLKIFHEEMGSTKPKPYIRPIETEKPVTTDEAVSSENREEALVTPIRKTPVTSKNDSLKSLHETKNTKAIAVTILGFALIGLIVFTKKMIDKYTKEAEVPTSVVEQTIKGATPVVTDGLPAPLNPDVPVNETPLSTPKSAEESSMSSPAPSAALTKSPSPTTTQTSAITTPAPAVAPAPAPNSKIETTSDPGATVSNPTPAATATATAAKPAPAVKTPAKPEESNKPVELIVEALDNVEIEYSAPNGKTQKIKLSAEQVHTFKSKSGLKINFSNGGAVNLIHNGKEVGIPGDLGKPIKLSY